MHVPRAFHLPRSGSMSGDVWGRAACPAGPVLSSPPSCTPRHHPGSLHPSSGSLLRIALQWPSFQPAWPLQRQTQGKNFSMAADVRLSAELKGLCSSVRWAPPHLAKAAFSQDGKEGEVAEFDLVHDVRGQRAGVAVVRLSNHLLTWT